MKTFEIEQKYRIKSPQAIRLQLKKLRAKLLYSGRQENEYLDLGSHLARKKSVLRLRQENHKAFLTFKGPKLRAKHTKRLEYETRVDYAQTKAMLKTIGFKRVLKYTKSRTTYALKKCTIALDHLPPFGWFLEIEGSPKSINRLERELHLSNSQREPRTYLAMMLTRRK